MLTRRSHDEAQPPAPTNLLPAWRRILVPAVAAPFSTRSIRTACQIADAVDNSEVLLVYVIEVPRALALQAVLPLEDSQAQDVLEDGLESARRFGREASTEVVRARDAVETLVKHLKTASIDLVVLGSRPDEVRGLTHDTMSEMFHRAGCQVIIDYISAEV